MFSFTFDAVDYGDYGVVIKKRRLPVIQNNQSVQLINRAYPLASFRSAGIMTLDISIITPSGSTLIANLDTIRQTLDNRNDCNLALDYYTDRYWIARFQSLDVELIADVLQGVIVFDLADPNAYDNTETDNDYTVDEDPEEITETSSGTAAAYPVLTLTCDDTLTATTVSVENEATGETVEWTGDLVAADILIIDCSLMAVSLNGYYDMSTVSGQFPRLLPGANILNVSGFSGNVNITYRNRYV